MNFDQYTKRSLEAIQLMQNLAGEYGNQQLEQCHLLLALLRQEEGLTPQLLRNMGLTPESLEAAARSMVEKLPKVSGGTAADRMYLSSDLDKTLRSAQEQSKAMKDDYVSVEHLFLALLDTANRELKNLFSTYRITREDCLKALQAIRGNQRVTTDSPEGTYDALNKYGTDLVKRARRWTR